MKKWYPRLMQSKGNETAKAAINDILMSGKVLPNVLIGQHLSGLFWHQHDVSVSIAVHGYRLWLFMTEAMEEPDSDDGIPPELSYFRNYPEGLLRPSAWEAFLKSYNRTKGFKLCCQPPGSIFYLPESAGHAVTAWSEAEERSGPVTINQKGGFTMSLTYQPYIHY